MADHERKKKRAGRNARSAVLLVVGIILLVLILAVGAAWFIYQHYYSKTNYIPDDQVSTVPPEIESSLDAEEPTLDPEEEAKMLAELEAIQKMIDEMKQANQTTEAPSTTEDSTEESSEADTEEPTEPPTEAPTAPPLHIDLPGAIGSLPDSDVSHIMLIGVDRRNDSWNGNSDTMILLSINRTKKTITLTSFMRDTAAVIPGIRSVKKLNYAYAIGGAPRLLQTIQSNYQIPVEQYAWVDFESMKKIMNIVGGIDLYLTVAEAKYVGITIDEPQVVHLNGNQALRHARDRSSGGNDYQRTQRQRNVIMAVLNKVKSGSLGDVNALVNEILPYVNHNIDSGTLLRYIANLISVGDYTIQQQRIPYDGMFGRYGEMLVPRFSETIVKFIQTVY